MAFDIERTAQFVFAKCSGFVGFAGSGAVPLRNAAGVKKLRSLLADDVGQGASKLYIADCGSFMNLLVWMAEKGDVETRAFAVEIASDYYFLKTVDAGSSGFQWSFAQIFQNMDTAERIRFLKNPFAMKVMEPAGENGADLWAFLKSEVSDSDKLSILAMSEFITQAIKAYTGDPPLPEWKIAYGKEMLDFIKGADDLWQVTILSARRAAGTFCELGLQKELAGVIDKVDIVGRLTIVQSAPFAFADADMMAWTKQLVSALTDAQLVSFCTSPNCASMYFEKEDFAPILKDKIEKMEPRLIAELLESHHFLNFAKQNGGVELLERLFDLLGPFEQKLLLSHESAGSNLVALGMEQKVIDWLQACPSQYDKYDVLAANDLMETLFLVGKEQELAAVVKDIKVAGFTEAWETAQANKVTVLNFEESLGRRGAPLHARNYLRHLQRQS